MSKVVVYICDACKKEWRDEGRPKSWIEVCVSEWQGSSREVEVRHFCGRGCFAIWAQKYNEARRGDRIKEEAPCQWNETIAAPAFHDIDPGATVINTRPPDYGAPTMTEE